MRRIDIAGAFIFSVVIYFFSVFLVLVMIFSSFGLLEIMTFTILLGALNLIGVWMFTRSEDKKFLESKEFSSVLESANKEDLLPILKAAHLISPLIDAYPKLKDTEQLKRLLFQEFDDLPNHEIKYEFARKIQHYLSELSSSQREAFLSKVYAYVGH